MTHKTVDQAFEQMRHRNTMEAMKQWCLDHYEQGADTMVECWSDDDYLDLIAHAQDTAQAWAVLRDVASAYADRKADAENSAF